MKGVFDIRSIKGLSSTLDHNAWLVLVDITVLGGSSVLVARDVDVAGRELSCLGIVTVLDMLDRTVLSVLQI